MQMMSSSRKVYSNWWTIWTSYKGIWREK